MRLIILLLAFVFVIAKSYELTITIETESISEAGKVEKIVLDRLKEYKPEIEIRTNNKISMDSCIFLSDTLSWHEPYYPRKQQIMIGH